jgi:hypothetical protein
MNLELLDRVTDARRTFGQRTFRKILIVVCWAIWKHRDEVIFDGERLSLRRWKMIFKEQLSLITHKAKPSLKLELDQ